ncbi:MAG: M20/M25/M40 family metallo-hydrolase [Eubacteriales bacterium]|nr:M20/M25/M40 family metallo-hydrolase [Eubacteriales bacterium]
MFGMIILALVVLFLAVILVRAAMFKPVDSAIQDNDEVKFDKERAIENLQRLVRCKTVSRYNHEEEDDAEFDKLTNMLLELYPNVFKTCELIDIDKRVRLFKWKGKNAGEPAVFMAHYDVVPVEEKNWHEEPFSAVIKDGVMWGRGTLDTKITFNGVLFAAETLISEGFMPENDIYMAFSGGEEVNGPGAKLCVKWFKEQGITPAFVIDEGGAVVENVFPGVSQKAALIGLAEKGLMNVTYTCESSGGHASSPKPHTPVGLLSLACSRLEAHPFKMKLSMPVRKMFDTLGRYSSFGYKIIFANMWCFSWILDLLGKKSGGNMNALMRTTNAFTMMQGSSAPNVIPPHATMVSNIRVNPEENVQFVLDYLKKTINDDSIKIETTIADEPSRVSTMDCEGWNKVSRAAASTWKCIVSPYLMTQCSDSRAYGEISDRVFRFSAMDVSMDEIGTIHGDNERVRLDTVERSCEFFIRLERMC